jgi:hypothetical protein
MTLCGVLKDILLVAASIMLWGTPVSPTQFFGYSIALAGMVYYKLGGETLKSYLAEAARRWAEFGQARPVQRKLLVAALVLFTLFVLMGGLAPAAGYDTSALAAKGSDIYDSFSSKMASMRSGSPPP